MKQTFVILSLTAGLTLSLVACGAKKEATQETSTVAPPLPSDVQSVAAAATSTDVAEAATATAASQTSAEGIAAPAVGGAIVASGEFASPVRSELAIRNPGRVAKMFVEEGSRVTKGQPLLQLEVEYVSLNLQKAQADSARAAAFELDAKRDLERKKELIAKDSIPKATYDRSDAAYQQAVAAHASANAQAGIFRQQLEDAVLRSPIDGVVAEKRTDVGQRLGDNTVALVVAQTAPLKLKFRVPERYLAQIHKGQPVKATVDPYPNQVFEGKVTVIGGVIDPATRSLLVETEFPNRDGRLRPGLFARVQMDAH